MIKGIFPTLSDTFYDVLCDRIKEHQFTDNEFTRAVKHVIDTCGYATPRIADFITFIHPDGEIPRAPEKDYDEEAYQRTLAEDDKRLERERARILAMPDDDEPKQIIPEGF